jgi:hypothetical protein
MKTVALDGGMPGTGVAIVPAALSSTLDAAGDHEEILRVTRDVFPASNISVCEEVDPESDSDKYFVVSVVTRGEIDDLATRHRQWHHSARVVASSRANNYRLLIDVE